MIVNSLGLLGLHLLAYAVTGISSAGVEAEVVDSSVNWTVDGTSESGASNVTGAIQRSSKFYSILWMAIVIGLS